MPSRRASRAPSWPPAASGALEDITPDVLTGFLPDHLAMATAPARGLDKRFFDPQADQRRRAVRRSGAALGDHDLRARQPLHLQRHLVPVVHDGTVETSRRHRLRHMIGPRHLLTCAHAIDWINPPNPYVAGWIKFTPSYFDGSEPFGVAWATHIYWQQQVAGPGIDTHRGAERLRGRGARPSSWATSPARWGRAPTATAGTVAPTGATSAIRATSPSDQPAVVPGQLQHQRRRHRAGHQPGHLPHRRRVARPIRRPDVRLVVG